MSGSKFLDSTVLIDLIRADRSDDGHLAFAEGEMHVSVVAWGEVLTGGQLIRQSTRERRRISLIETSVTLVPVNATTARYYATVLAQLTRDGKRIPTNDIWIAATAMEHGLPLDTTDAHFDRVEGLTRA